ncbi:MAG: L,D-transpeptidase [Melioribacteraceae bacterium]|nr:L,D-transpeptidase [Melioribacteraceae bacterium]MCF8264876.1 L,D-transpeptidase [Melioribacteraceae bacterium]MCF8412994.1 L,D-transpeptidase [Melioribacteraceae bacterium]MCF8431345.1 L,D-transpeptidase [Melioribacteraceae bacterium]
MFKNIIYVSSSIVIFFFGLILYGIIINPEGDSLEKTLSEKGVSKTDDIRIVVDRKNYKLELYSDSTLIKSYKAVFGRNSGPKSKYGDYATPIGIYHICSIDTSQKYYKVLMLNYPNKRDAAEGLKNGFITNSEFQKIIEDHDDKRCISSDTGLGGNIGIYGTGDYDFILKNLPFVFNWTNGSIALSNNDIDEIVSLAKVDMEVEIRN